MWKGTWNILFAFSRLYSNGLRARINLNPTVLFFQVIRFVHVGANPMNWVILVGEQPHAWCSMLGCTLVTQVNEPFAFLTSSVFLHHCLFFLFFSVHKLSLHLSPRLLHRQREHRHRCFVRNRGHCRPGLSQPSPCHKEQSFWKTPSISQRYKQVLKLSSSTPSPHSSL